MDSEHLYRSLNRPEPLRRRSDHEAVRIGHIIGEFASARDARLFAGIKREAGEACTVTSGINYPFAVRLVL